MNEDRFLELFDRFVQWPARLAKEGPFLEKLLRQAGAEKVLDAGAGTGRHAAWLARKGFQVWAADAAESMVRETRKHAQEEGVAVEAVQCAFEDVPSRLPAPVDAVLCIGNSLCMLPDAGAVRRALGAFARVLRPGGALILHALNYRGLRATGKRVSRPAPLPGGGLVLKVFDLDPGAVRVNLIHMEEKKPGAWTADHAWAPLLPLLREDLEAALAGEGFGELAAFGDADGRPFEPDRSYDLFLTAKRGA
ncbi:MAG: class I SAM-dependent methyltransferase [Planctomycetes bacterium]|jgi:SAM-dependent methyltransferase|nr:class I SAM-dependent methyltransferase [Planctomycetota bacterium]